MKYDVIIIGSGAGGSAAAYQLAQSGKKVLILEQGAELPKDGSTLDVEKVMRKKIFLESKVWHDEQGKPIVPQERSNIGGKTKWYGAALLRFGSNEFSADSAYQYLPWPFPGEELNPYYEQAEQLLQIRHFPIEPDFQKIVAGLQQRDSRWCAESLPMGLSAEILNNLNELKHFDGFASPHDLKADAETKFLSDIRTLPNVDLFAEKKVIRLDPAPNNPLTIQTIHCADGSQYQAGTVFLAGGAMHSPRLLQRYCDITGLAKTLPCYNMIGRNYKFHLLTAMLMLSASRKTDLLRKTTVMTHDDFLHSSMQPLGWMDGELLGPELPGFFPRWLANMIGTRVYGFFLQTEDGSHPDNRVIAESDTGGTPHLHYNQNRIPASADEHKRFVRKLQRDLLSIGYIGLTKSIPITGSTHSCGTLVAGNDPQTSVVDRKGKVHGMENVYVVDGSILPRLSRVNPALTIYAWALRVAKLFSETTKTN